MISYRYDRKHVELTQEEEQALENWKPPSLFVGATLFIIVGIYLLIVGIVTEVLNSDIQTYTIEYHTQEYCPDLKQQCIVILNIKEDIVGPIYIYYEMHNFNQNHKKYLDSYDKSQVTGDYDNTDPSKCDPYITNAQMGKLLSVTGNELDPNAVAIPCGVRAKTYFDDTFIIRNPDFQEIAIDSNNIAWDYDKKRQSEDYRKQWIDMTDEHFMVWMRPAGLSKFKKLYGRINHDLPKGEYQIVIQNNFNTTYYDSQKYFILTTLSSIGGRNPVLTTGHIITGAILLVVSLILIKMQVSKNKMNEA